MHQQNITTPSTDLNPFPIKLQDDNAPESPDDLSSWLLDHVSDCADCLFAIMDDSKPLADAGCEKFKAMLRSEALLPYGPSRSPLTFACVEDEKIEEYCFGRLSEIEVRLFEDHVHYCAECTKRVSEQREFIRVMKAILEDAPVAASHTSLAIAEELPVTETVIPQRARAAGR